ncbi:MAG: acyl-CoA synthetase (NDP forming) [Cellvibrionaceae bacterium]|jgi:acyl-CoA synthetase (NDP forming)
MATPLQSIHRLLRPKTIAVIGGSWAASVIEQCDKIGYAGEIWPVNPKKETMGGRKCFPNVASLPAAPDAVFIGVKRELTPGVVAELSQMGAGGAVCFAAGFAETGEPVGLALHQELLDSMGDMAIVGPNCYGVLNYLDGVTLWPDEQGGKRIEKGVAIITQSGNISISMSMQQRSLPLAYLIASGNQAGVTTPEYVNALLDDERVTAIGLHMEGVNDIEAFARCAIKALEKKVPIAILKTGASAVGSAIALSHTSSLTGSDKLYDAFFERYGIVRVQSITELLETLKFLSIIGPIPTNGIATISSSGGEAALAADIGERLGLTFPPIHPEQRAALAAVLGERVELNNPLDYHTYIWGQPEKQQKAFRAMMTGDQSVTMKILDFPRPDICDPTKWVETARAFQRAAKDLDHPAVLLATMHENLPDFVAEEMLEHGIVPMLGMQKAFLAAKGAAQVYAAYESGKWEVVSGQSLREGEVVTLDEFESKRLLAEFGIPVPESAVATADSAGAVAENFANEDGTGYPVVAKVLSADIVHKSDVGGVHVNLRSAAEVEQAVAAMAHLSDKFLVEKMASKPIVEMILGLTRDPQFGLALVVGAGGVWVEVLKDSQTLLLPVSREDAAKAIEKLKIAPLLNGYRGQPPADKGAIIAAMIALSKFGEAHADSLVEVDVNPLFALEDGVIAVDGVVRLVE